MGKTSKGKAISKERNAAIEPVVARGEKLRRADRAQIQAQGRIGAG
jgi:hypothetical protein